MQKKFLFFTITTLLTSFLLQGVGTQSWAKNSVPIHLSTTNSYISEDVVYKDQLKEAIVGSNLETLHLFSHGKSGALFLENQWHTASQIAKWISKNYNLNKFEQVNIYGCEFAKDQKGKTAVAYLEKTLGICVAASDDITGKHGDWELEIGSPSNVLVVEKYAYNLQCDDNLFPADGSNTYSNIIYPFASTGTVVTGVDYYEDVHNQNVSGTTSGWYFDSNTNIGILDGNDFTNSNITGNIYAATASNACAYYNFGSDLALDPTLTYCIAVEFAYLGEPGINWGDPAFVRMLVQFDDFDGVASHTQIGGVYGWSPDAGSTTILNAGGRHATKAELEDETNWQTEIVYTLTATDITNINTGNADAVSFHVSTSMGSDAYIYSKFLCWRMPRYSSRLFLSTSC